MKDIILKELTLENCKGQSRRVTFGAHTNRISGYNKAGKSSLMKAFYWLVSGYSDAQTNPNSDLFDNTQEINEHTPKACVTAIISIDGEDYKLQRTAEAKFTRKRGTDIYEKASSDTYEFFVDDIKRTSTDFNEWLEQHIAPSDMLRFVLDGSFFIDKIFDDKKQARQIIEKTVGSVTRDEMCGDYSIIEELLQKYSLDEIDLRAQNMAKGIEQRLNEIPSLIQSKQREISEIEQVDFAALDKEISALETERDELDKRMTDLSERVKPQMEAKHRAESERQAKQDVFDKAYTDWHRGITARMEKIADEVNAVRRQNEKSETARKDAEDRRELAKSDLESLEKQLHLLQQKRMRLLEERDEAKTMAMVGEGEEVLCPFCGKPLTGDKLQEEYNKFEQKKRERINEIVAEGKEVSEKIKRLNESIERTKKMIEEPLPQAITQSTEELEKQYAELAKMDKSRIAFMETEHGKVLLDDIGSVVIPEVKMPETEDIEAAKRNVNDRLVPLYERRGLKNRLTTLRDALDVLRIEQKDKGAELATYEQQRQAVKDYKQEQMEILSRKVNDGLKFSRLEVWSKQKDGNIIPDIVIKNKDGVSFATANNASRLVTTIDIQRFFCERLGVNMPIFLDEASTIDTENIPHYDNTQMFLLFRADTSLKIDSK